MYLVRKQNVYVYETNVENQLQTGELERLVDLYQHQNPYLSQLQRYVKRPVQGQRSGLTQQHEANCAKCHVKEDRKRLQHDWGGDEGLAVRFEKYVHDYPGYYDSHSGIWRFHFAFGSHFFNS